MLDHYFLLLEKNVKEHSDFCSYILNLQMLCEPPIFQSFIKIIEVIKPHYENICKLVGKKISLYYHVNQP